MPPNCSDYGSRSTAEQASLAWLKYLSQLERVDDLVLGQRMRIHHRRDGRHIAWQAFRKLSRFDIQRDPVTRKHSSESVHPGVGQS